MTTTAAELPQSRLQLPANQHFDDNRRRARYGAAYLRAMCAHAGVAFTETSADEDASAVDGAIDFVRMPVRVQIKCTSTFAVSGGKATLQVKPAWAAKWSESDTPIFVVVVKVPREVPDWTHYDAASTHHNTVAFGRRFIAETDEKSMAFTSHDRLTTESIYDWRDLAYDIADGVVV